MQKQELPELNPRPSLREQIKLERRMVAGGITRYRNGMRSAEEDGRGSDTKYAQKLLHTFVKPVADEIAAWANLKTAGVHGKYKPYIRMVDPEVAAFIALKAVFNHFMVEQTLPTLAGKIGQCIEDELRFSQFQQEYGTYYDAIIDDFSKKGTTSYRHMHRVLVMKSNEKGVKHKSWEQATRVAVGVKLIDCIMNATDLLEKTTGVKKKGKVAPIVVKPSQAALDWVLKFNHAAELMYPEHMPCLIEPDPWISFDQGGFYTPHLRSRVKLVKTASPQHIKMFQGDISHITRAVNELQKTEWAVNTDVYNVMKVVWDKSLGIGLPSSEPYVFPECPIPKTIKKQDMDADQTTAFNEWKFEMRTLHTMEKERVSQCFQVIRCLRLAQEYSNYPGFWFVYQCDFRGRIYATVSGLSPQGADFAKGILRFARADTLGERGVYWLKVHGANTYGKDKVPFGDRVSWVEQNSDAICAVADDPIGTRDFWGNADKPWQFLAFCFEYKRYRLEGPSMRTTLPIGLDGSCNGLQNFSALLRDGVGGAATNLVPGEQPRDIYAEVAAVCHRKLVDSDDECAGYWKTFLQEKGLESLPRGLAKKPVMTLPYGSTQKTCRDSVYEWMVANDCIPKKMRLKCCNFIAPLLWASISEVVIAARGAMDWLQRASAVISKTNKPIIWWSPIGFPVLQDRKRKEIQRVATQLLGSIKLTIEVDTKNVDPFKQRLGIAPNFVHSLDAAHLMRTINTGTDEGITSWACIHDDFGTHAGKVDTLFRVLREEFVKMYTNTDPLQEFKLFHEAEYNITLPPLPKLGSLNINQVIDSKYFFA